MTEERKLAQFDPWPHDRSAGRGYTVVDLETGEAHTYGYLRAYWKVLTKHGWTILAVALSFAALMAVVSFQAPPVYRATARVEVETESPPFRSVENLDRAVLTDSTFLQTQVSILESDNLAWETIRQLQLNGNPASTLARLHGGSDSEKISPAAQGRLLREFKKHLQVELAGNTRLIEVSFESKNPVEAARVANTLVNNYAQYNFLTGYNATRQASEWMEQQLNDLKNKVKRSQEALVSYERRNSIVNVSDKQNVTEQRLADLSRDLTEAESDLATKQSLDQLVQANPKQVALLAQNQLLQTLEEKSANLRAAYVDALGEYGPKFPKVVRLRDQVNEIQSLIEQERKRTVERIQHEYQAALGRRELLAAAVTQGKTEVGKLNERLIQHNILKHEFESNQQLYDSLLLQVKDATVSAGLRANNVQVVDQALVPSIPVRPNKLLNIILGLMLGLIAGTTLAFVREGLNTSIKTAEDLESSIDLPVLGVIPQTASMGPSPSWLSRARSRAAKAHGDVEWAILRQPNSALAESYRMLRTAVLLSVAPQSSQALLVTSAQPNEGKTAVSFNLAAGLAQLGKRVIILDADLRQPGLARVVSLPGRVGLSSFLSGTSKLEEVLFYTQDAPNLCVLPAGPQPPNPADLLSSTVMTNLLAELRQRFDYLVLDTPAVLAVTDATVLSRFVDGVILVTESQATARDGVIRAHKILESAGARILGCVLNKLDLKHDGYYGSCYRRYSRYYSRNLQSANPALWAAEGEGPSLPKT